MSDHPDFVAIKARHRSEIDELTAAFGKQYSTLVNLEPLLRDPAQIHELRKKHRTEIQEAVARHVKVENEWREPVADTPARFVANATTLDQSKED